MGANFADELIKLKDLLDKGVITQQEFKDAKKKILSQGMEDTEPQQVQQPLEPQQPVSEFANQPAPEVQQTAPPQQTPPPKKSSGCLTAFVIVVIVFVFLFGVLMAWGSCTSRALSSDEDSSDGVSSVEPAKVILDASVFGGKTIDELKQTMPEIEDSGTVDIPMANGETVTANYYSYSKDGVNVMFSVLDSKVVTANIVWSSAQSYSGNEKEILSLVGISAGNELTEVADTGAAIRWECVADGISEVWVTEMDSTAKTFSGVKVTYDSAVSGRMPGEPEKDDLEILSYDSTSDEFYRYVTGKIRNNTDKTYSYVQVEINLYSGDNLVGSTLDNVNNLGPGEIWEFNALVLEDSVDSFKIVGITKF